MTYVIAAHYGLGRHRDAVPVDDYTTYLKMTFIQALVSTIGSLLFLKLSIGFSLIRMSQQKWYTRVTWGFICKTFRSAKMATTNSPADDHHHVLRHRGEFKLTRGHPCIQQASSSFTPSYLGLSGSSSASLSKSSGTRPSKELVSLWRRTRRLLY